MTETNIDQTINIQSTVWPQRQFFPQNIQQPEVDLWGAVLKRAVRDLQDFVRLVRADSSLWNIPDFKDEAQSLLDFFVNPSYEIGGFGFICAIFNTTPEALKKNKAMQAIQELEMSMRNHNPKIQMH
ncbi:hypothetical protein ACQZV8_21620 [Magnetococcales bacterium HHB-1]